MDTPPSDTPESSSLSLHQLLHNVDRAIQSSLPSTYWVRAEILQVQDRGWWALELSSYDEGKKAKARAMIWQSQKSIVHKFEQATGAELAKGLKILARVKVSFHAEYGLSLTIQDIDPVFSLGDMEARVNQIRERLSALYELNLNRELPTPREFTRVAVIAPNEAAGLGDFRSQADQLESFGLCQFDYFSAAFQGESSEQSLISAMKSILDQHRDKPFDVVCLIRGGGDKAGIYELNQFRIARGVCRLPIPVFVGVGHERDSTILDEVANATYPTPSLVIASIAGSIIANANMARSHYEKLTNSSRQVLDSARSSCMLLDENIGHLAARTIALARDQVSRRYQQISVRPRELLQEAKRSLGQWHSAMGHNALIWLSHQQEYLKMAKQELHHHSVQSLNESRAMLRIESISARGAARSLLSRAQQVLQVSRHQLLNESSRNIQLSRSLLEKHHNTVVNLNPDVILKRGFVIVKDASGLAVTHQTNLPAESKVTLTFQDGTVDADIQKN